MALLKVGLAAGLAIAGAFTLWRMQPKPEKPAPTAWSTAPAAPRNPLPSAQPVKAELKENGLSQEDAAFLNGLAARLNQSPGATPTEEEIDRVEKIFAAHSEEAQIKDLLLGAYLRRAEHDLQLGSFALVDQSLEKMKRLDDRQPQVYAFETHERTVQSDWAAAVAAAQKYESLSGEATPMMSAVLAQALAKLDRKGDALAVLDRPVFQVCPTATASDDVSACRAAESMRQALQASSEPSGPAARVRSALNVDPSKQLIQSERFDIRFDGESQSGVARDVLFVLDRAYTRLADIYYDRPTRKIPVVLHSGQDYYTKTGAPWWSGGVYDSHDGAIQIPVRGLPSTLPREMEDVLVHELSHAFVDEMSGGFAGRDLQEGLAQYMEGKRIEQELGLPELKRLANSGRQSVMSFYMLSLAVSQQLVQSRGQGRVNELLKAMKETGSEDGGFRKVFSQSGTDIRKDILDTFWRRYS
jgi:hypothetical protein